MIRIYNLLLPLQQTKLAEEIEKIRVEVLIKESNKWEEVLNLMNFCKDTCGLSFDEESDGDDGSEFNVS